MKPRGRRISNALARLTVTGALAAGCVAPDEATQSVAEPIVVCARGPTVEGVDVSIYQGASIDWNAVHASGREFAITRVGDGLGGDSTFVRNWAGIRAAGMIRGVYQFFRPNRDPNAQADIVCAAVGTLGPGDLPAMLDLEADNGVSPAGIRAAIDVWLARVRACTGKQPMIYTAGWFWNPHVASTAYSGYPLVVAAYGPRCPDLPQGWSDWLIYQYSDGEERYTPGVGSVPGIGMSVDRDRFNGTLDDLRRFAQSNRPPVGYLDHAGCDTLAGWSMDPDAPDTALDVHLYIGGPAGSGAPGFVTHASRHRDDLCAAIGSCNHGFSLATPAGFADNADHPVFAYGIDAMGGDNPQLGTATIHCAPPTPPIAPTRGVRRHVPSPEVLAAWRWTGHDIAHLDDATLNAFADGPDVVASPSLVRASTEDAVYVVENRTLRHVTSPDAMDAWRFPWDSIRVAEASEVHANLAGAALPNAPFLAVGSGPAVYLVDEPPPLWAQIVSAPGPSNAVVSGAATVAIALRNRGSATWQPGEVWLVPSQPREHDSALCDASTWRSCRQSVSVPSAVAPGESVTLNLTLRAPSAPGDHRECFALRDGTFYFSDPGQLGFADDALCLTLHVTETPPPVDAGVPASDSAVPPGDAPPPAADSATDANVVVTDTADDAVTATPDDGGDAHNAPIEGSCGCRAARTEHAEFKAFLALVALATAARRRRDDDARRARS